VSWGLLPPAAVPWRNRPVPAFQEAPDHALLRNNPSTRSRRAWSRRTRPAETPTLCRIGLLQRTQKQLPSLAPGAALTSRTHGLNHTKRERPPKSAGKFTRHARPQAIAPLHDGAARAKSAQRATVPAARPHGAQC